jgi:hypothetical protein
VTKRLYAIRIDDRDDTHPSYVGPLPFPEAQDLADRLHAHSRSFEMALLYTEAELPGLWLKVEEGS